MRARDGVGRKCVRAQHVQYRGSDAGSTRLDTKNAFGDMGHLPDLKVDHYVTDGQPLEPEIRTPHHGHAVSIGS